MIGEREEDNKKNDIVFCLFSFLYIKQDFVHFLRYCFLVFRRSIECRIHGKFCLLLMLVIMCIERRIISNLVRDNFIVIFFEFCVYLETLYIRRRSQLLRDNRPIEVPNLIDKLIIDIYIFDI